MKKTEKSAEKRFTNRRFYGIIVSYQPIKTKYYDKSRKTQFTQDSPRRHGSP
jgi:hypothetical protein